MGFGKVEEEDEEAEEECKDDGVVDDEATLVCI